MRCRAPHPCPQQDRARQPPAWSAQDETVVPSRRQRGREGSHRGVPSAAGTEVVTQRGRPRQRWRGSASRPPTACAGEGGCPRAVIHAARPHSRIAATEHGLGCSHHDPPSAPRSTIARWASPHTHTWRRRVQPRGTSCPSRLWAHPAVAVAWVCARGVVRHGHDTTSGRDALTVAPVRPQGPTGGPRTTACSRWPSGKGTGPLGHQHPWAMAWARRSPSFSRCGRMGVQGRGQQRGSSDAAAVGARLWPELLSVRTEVPQRPGELGRRLAHPLRALGGSRPRQARDCSFVLCHCPQGPAHQSGGISSL